MLWLAVPVMTLSILLHCDGIGICRGGQSKAAAATQGVTRLRDNVVTPTNEIDSDLRIVRAPETGTRPFGGPCSLVVR
jgi:hypothetical protein